MSKVFRAKYVAALKSRLPEVDKQLVNSLFKKEWVVGDLTSETSG
jgi:hypothetical protein